MFFHVFYFQMNVFFTFMPSDVVHNFKEFLQEHQNTFAKSSDDLGFSSLVKHDIDTGDAKPIRQPPGRPPLASGKTGR